MTNPMYLDPGSASIILQMITGGVVAAIVAVKVFWQRILTVLHIRPADAKADAASRPENR
jgi:hypothetical protein